MPMNSATQLIQRYYDAFNHQDMTTFINLLDDNVVHDINQGGREVGKAAFTSFMEKMNHHYRETLTDIILMSNEDGSRVAAEFVVHGEYLQTDSDLPPASGQRYTLPAGAFFTIQNNKITRISNYYNLNDWIAQVAPA